MAGGIEPPLIPGVVVLGGPPQLAIDIGLGTRVQTSLRVTGGHSIHLDLGADPFLGIATSLFLNSKFARQRLRLTYDEVPVMVRLSIEKEGVLAGLADPNIARALREAKAKIHRIEWMHNLLILDVEKEGVGRAWFEASFSADEKQRVLVVQLGQNSLPGGVWPSTISEVYPCVKVAGTRMEIHLRQMEAVGWEFQGTRATLTLILRLRQLLDLMHLHD